MSSRGVLCGISWLIFDFLNLIELESEEYGESVGRSRVIDLGIGVGVGIGIGTSVRCCILHSCARSYARPAQMH